VIITYNDLGIDDKNLTVAKARSGGRTGTNVLSERRVAVFGNSEASKPGDWVQILVSNFPQSTSSSNRDTGVCRSMVTALHVEVAYANAGSFNNAQVRFFLFGAC
jgi:hypothetical protein